MPCSIHSCHIYLPSSIHLNLLNWCFIIIIIFVLIFNQLSLFTFVILDHKGTESLWLWKEEGSQFLLRRVLVWERLFKIVAEASSLLHNIQKWLFSNTLFCTAASSRMPRLLLNRAAFLLFSTFSRTVLRVRMLMRTPTTYHAQISEPTDSLEFRTLQT